MCGILGGIQRAGSLKRERIEHALTSIAHRGPDAEGIYEKDGVFLGHRRLSIIDLDPRANQPMRVGSNVISFNGEIYNYRSLREDFIKRGFTFYTESDTEIIALAFREEGLRCLERLEGMFAFAIWDEETQLLTLVRDRFGEKPLLYYQDAERFYFASEATALEDLIGREALTIDPDAMRLYFQLSYIPAPYASYRNMRQLMPGSWLQFHAKTGEILQGRYYEAKPKPCSLSKQAAIHELRTKLTDSVTLRLTASDVPVATFLSGGIDSSIITALAAIHSPQGVRAYSIAFPEDPEFDESSYARMVAARYPQITHTVINTTERALLEFTDRTLGLLGEPYADASLIPTAFLCSQVGEKVILGGDGADELFAGYGVYAAMRTSARIPGVLKALLRMLPLSGNPHAIRHSKLRAFALFHSHLSASSLDEYISWRSYTTQEERLKLGLGGSDADLHALLGDPSLKTLADLLALDIAFNLPNDMLKKVDLASMQHGLEVRAPFLDRELVEFALGLPEAFLINNRERKHILREAFRDLLPAPILDRRKQGFLLPIRRWFKNGIIRERLLELLKVPSPLDKTEITRFLHEHQTETKDHSILLWSCYVYLTWYTNKASQFTKLCVEQ